ncbi:MAG TPA: MarR family transcriptional regulator [Candidatus Eisenbergiella merdipullorum]|uniref:MarR family transcriptional regulator n=1 Tax=Candidatus Eisenbergiella merdipullorum TaxID=2838553 RepID=A0A9D2L046_9FIRM|nr:MarR family transcriptional regulator [Candidatus Eisenbergiella merdipullorum]
MELDCGAWINLLSHKVKARLDATLQDLGITGVQSRVIYYILSHCQEGPVFQRDIENVFGLSRSTATGILQLLEKNGIIRRESVASDARLKKLVPTQRAVDLDTQVSACLRETDRMLTRGLTKDQVLLFKEMAAQMLRNLDDWSDGMHSCTDGLSTCPARKAASKTK